MGIELLPDGRGRVVYHYRRADGTKTQKRRLVDDPTDKRVIARTWLELSESVEGSLTTTTYKALSERYRQDRGDGGEAWRFARLEKEFGRRRVDRKLAYHYSRFVGSLTGLSANTVSHYKSILQRVLNYGYRQGLVDEVPIRDWGIRLTYRNRVWNADERTRIYNALGMLQAEEEVPESLLWFLRFMEARPCRWQSDARNLTTGNLVTMGPDAERLGPHIRYQPRKTATRKPRLTYLPLLDRRTGEPFDAELYAYLRRQTGLLFPGPRGGRLAKLSCGAWADVCAKAEVTDLHLHDLKHVAVTRMLRDEGWTRQEMRELGIQYSDRALDVYYHEDAEAVLAAVRKRIADARRGPFVDLGRAVGDATSCPQHGSNVRPQV